MVESALFLLCKDGESPVPLVGYSQQGASRTVIRCTGHLDDRAIFSDQNDIRKCREEFLFRLQAVAMTS